MYSNKEQVNILTALLVAYGVKHAVVCPGSRNAPIVHNLNECPDIKCYNVYVTSHYYLIIDSNGATIDSSNVKNRSNWNFSVRCVRDF